MVQTIPEKVLETFEYWLGNKVDPSTIKCFPNDGYKDHKHGEFDLYVLRRDGALYKVRLYQDGNIHYY